MLAFPFQLTRKLTVAPAILGGAFWIKKEPVPPVPLGFLVPSFKGPRLSSEGRTA